MNSSYEKFNPFELNDEDLIEKFEKAVIAKYLENVCGKSENSVQYLDLKKELKKRIFSHKKNMPLEEVVQDIFPTFDTPLKNINACVTAMLVRKGMIDSEELDEIIKVAKYIDVEYD